jgi:hypothetical protein
MRKAADKSFLYKLTSVANKLDERGLTKEADALDEIIRLAARQVQRTGAEELARELYGPGAGDPADRLLDAEGDLSFGGPSEAREGDTYYTMKSKRFADPNRDVQPPEKGVISHKEEVGDETYYLIESFQLDSNREEWENDQSWEPEDWDSPELVWQSDGYHVVGPTSWGDGDEDTIAEPSDTPALREFDPETDDPGELLRNIVQETKASREEGDDDWRREMAMEEGMLHGVDAYNDAMGQSIFSEEF